MFMEISNKFFAVMDVADKGNKLNEEIKAKIAEVQTKVKDVKRRKMFI